MIRKKDVASLFLCYVLWGFQPLYWGLGPTMDSYTLLFCRIVMAAVFSVSILAVTHRLGELKALFHDRQTMKFLLPAVVFLLADWTVFLVVVNAGHVLDASLGFYINPLMLFALGVVFFKERCTRIQLLALAVAAVGVVISTVTFGSFPVVSMVIAVNWAIYAAIKKNVTLDGVLSIAAETLILVPLSLVFLLLFRQQDLLALEGPSLLFVIGSGIVTAMPMYLYSNSVSRFSLIFMCFAQYLSPTFNLICGLIMGERFSPSQIVSFLFFVTAIVLFTAGELLSSRSKPTEA